MQKTNHEDEFLSENVFLKKSEKPITYHSSFMSELPVISVKKYQNRLPIIFLEAIDELRQYPFFPDVEQYIFEIERLYNDFPHSGRKSANIIYFIFRFFTINDLSIDDLATEIMTVMPAEIKKMTRLDNYYFNIWNTLCSRNKEFPNNTHLTDAKTLIFTKIIGLVNIFKYGSSMPVINVAYISSFIQYLKETYPALNKTLVYLFQIHTKFFLSQKSQKNPAGNKRKMKIEDLSDRQIFEFVDYFYHLIKDIASAIFRFILNYETSINHLFHNKYTAITAAAELPRLIITEDFAIEDAPFLIIDQFAQKINIFRNNISGLCNIKPHLQKIMASDINTCPIINLYFKEYAPLKNSTVFFMEYQKYSMAFFENLVKLVTLRHQSLFNKAPILTELVREMLNLPNNLQLSMPNLGNSVIASPHYETQLKKTRNIDQIINKESAIVAFFRLKHAKPKITAKEQGDF